MKNISTPDHHARGFVRHAPQADRYENLSTAAGDVAACVAAQIPAGARVLDVGSGTGCIAEAMRKMTGADILCIEPDPERVLLARARGLSVIEGFLDETIIYTRGPFDVVTFTDVLEHLPDPGAVVLLATKALVRDGAIIVSVPNIAHWFVRLDLLLGRFDYQECGIMDATHLRWFTEKTLREFFLNLGLRVTTIQHTINIDLPDYQNRRPWRWLPRAARRDLIRVLVKLWPRLFGCQHVVRAELIR